MGAKISVRSGHHAGKKAVRWGQVAASAAVTDLMRAKEAAGAAPLRAGGGWAGQLVGQLNQVNR